MYLNIGNDMSVRSSCIVGIFDLDNTTVTARGRHFLRQAEQQGNVIPCDDLPKSYIVTVQYGMMRIYLTPYTSQTLEKRLKNG